MDFAPYQSSPPEHGRVASPDYNASSPRASQDNRRAFSPAARSPPPLQHPQPQRGWTGFDGQTSGWAAGAQQPMNATGAMPGGFPAAEISDFVRFHAWQSALLFTSIMVLHLIFSWSSFLG